MHDGQAVGIDRPVRALGNEIVHDRQEAGGQEKAHGIVAVPPLGQRILHAGIDRIGAGSRPAHRHREIVDDVQHRDSHDEREIEPVGHIDMRLLALPDRAQEDQQIGHPDNGQPEVGIPFRLGILLGLGHPDHIAGCGDGDEELVAPEHEPGPHAASEPRAAGALDDIEAGGDKDVAAERKDHRAGVQRAQASEVQPANLGKVEKIRPGQLQGDDDAHEEADKAPEHGGGHAELDDGVLIFGLVENIAVLDRAAPDEQCGKADPRKDDKHPGMDVHQDVGGLADGKQRPQEHGSEKPPDSEDTGVRAGWW